MKLILKTGNFTIHFSGTVTQAQVEFHTKFLDELEVEFSLEYL